MDDLYRENILEHYRHPQNFGTLDNPTFEAEGVNPLCGDELHVHCIVEDGVVEEIKFSGHGCAISQASMSMLTDEIRGKTVEEVSAMSRQDVLDLIGIPLTPVRLKCALLGLVVTKMGLHENLGTEAPVGWEGIDEIAWSGAPA
jgi:nitrogen fixation NifU-like protein